jgi:hypothetical protein
VQYLSFSFAEINPEEQAPRDKIAVSRHSFARQ